jgi:DNA-binding MarR family transcriptional regulator
MVVPSETVVKPRPFIQSLMPDKQDTTTKRRNGAQPDSGPLRLDRFIPYRLSVLAARVTGRLAREYESVVGLQLPEARVMTVLGFFKPISSNAIVQHTSMDKATVSRAVARLIRLGMITRKPDPRDRRLLVLGFTPRGQRVYARLTKLARGWESWFLDELTPVERTRLERTLALLSRRLDGGVPG